jgi:excisionase family DNA binding protein
MELLTVKKVAEVLQCSPSHIYDLVAARRIPSIRIPGCKKIYFDRASLDEYLKALEDRECLSPVVLTVPAGGSGLKLAADGSSVTEAPKKTTPGTWKSLSKKNSSQPQKVN